MKRDAIETISLPAEDRRLQPYHVREPRKFARPDQPFTRIAYAAAHVVADPWSDRDPWLETAVDWDATIAFRRHLWSWGLGVAEAMDTAQRGMGMDWPASLELIRRTLDAAKGVTGATVGCGAGTDHLPVDAYLSVERVIAAYEEQCAAVEKLGGRIVLMASRALRACATSPDDYGRVYDRILSQVKAPVIIHWLGEMFDPALDGYWGHRDHAAAMDVCADVLRRNAAKVAGIKVALLDQSIVAGIGNIYASEALWRARIDPRTPANRLTRDRLGPLVRAVRATLQAALRRQQRYYGSQREGASYHSPLNCLPGSGWTLSEPGKVMIPAPDGSQFAANKYIIDNGDSQSLMLYWYQGRGRKVASEYWGKIYTVIDSVRLRRSDGAMVRVTVPVGESEEAALKSALDLSTRAVAALPEFVPN